MNSKKNKLPQMIFFHSCFYKKVISVVLLFAIFLGINAPAVYAIEDFSLSRGLDFVKDFKFDKLIDLKRKDSKIFTKKDELYNSEKDNLPTISREKLVALLVEEDLLQQPVGAKIRNYAEDIKRDLNASVFLLKVPRNASVLEIEEGLEQLYFSGYNNDNKSQLEGVIIVGNVPIPVVDKGGRPSVTIFPYVDFENKNYLWSEEKEKFIWEAVGDEEAEIWHGIIRSDADSYSEQLRELDTFFTKNHQIHQGQGGYSKKVFIADLGVQRKGISDKQKEFYDNWINHLEDFVYLRFSKHWLTKLLEKNKSVIPDYLLPEQAQGQNQVMDFSFMPDVFAKNPIEQMSMQYLKANENFLIKTAEKVESSGRWDASDIDTTISLISKKDQWAVDLIKKATDELEEILILKSREKNVAQEIRLVANNISTPPKYFSSKWLGIEKSNFKNYNWRTDSYDEVNAPEFPAENCTLYRGTIRTEDNLLAQKVEISRVFDPNLYTDDSNDRCRGKTNGDSIDYSQCRMPGYIEDMNTGSIVSVWSWDNVGDEFFSQKGTKEVFDSNYDGASGCAPVIYDLQSAEVKALATPTDSFSSMMLHNEPTLDTIKHQIDSITSTSIPIDTKHGISFYDHDYVFHRINFPTAFELINTVDELSENFEIDIKRALTKKLEEVIAQINSTSGNEEALEIDFFAESYWFNEEKQLELMEAIKWIGTELEQKNVQMLTGAFSENNQAQEVFKDDSFNGYEIVEIRGELATVKDQKGLKIAFERGNEKPTEKFIDAQSSQKSFIDDSKNKITENLEADLSSSEKSELQKEFDQMFEKAKEDSSCNGSLLTWPSACLIPWLRSLPDMLGQHTKLIPQISEVSNKEEHGEQFSDSADQDETSFILVDEKDEDDENISKLSLSAEKIDIFSRDSLPQEIIVSLLDNQGNLLKKDYQTEVELIPSSSDFERFFSVVPGEKSVSEAGKAKFHLLPKKDENNGGNLSLKFKTSSISSQNLPIKIFNNSLQGSSEETELTVGSGKNTRILVRAIDQNNKVTNDFDGKVVLFKSQEGGFFSDELSGARALIKNGVAEIIFQPKNKAGEATIYFQDEGKRMPQNSLKIKLLPHVPAKIVFNRSPKYLVLNSQENLFKTTVADKYGNLIDSENNFKFVFKNADWKSQVLENGLTNIYNEDEKIKSKELGFSVYTNISNQKISRDLTFTVIKNPTFELQVPDQKLIAGDNQELKIEVFAKINEKEVLKNDFTADLILEKGDLSYFSQKINFKNGKGLISIVPSDKSGKVDLKIVEKGFISSFFSLDILPNSPEQIIIKTDYDNLNADDLEPIDVKINVFDRFGNIANFNGEVDLELNSLDDLENVSQDLKNLDIFDNSAKAEQFVQDQLLEVNSVVTTPIIELEKNKISLRKGTGSTKIYPRGIGGKAYLLARGSNLNTGTLELDITKLLTNSDFKYLSPKSLLTNLWGFPGADFGDKSLGNRFIFEGNTQAVATTTNSNKDKLIGSIDIVGNVSPDLSVEILNSNFPLFLINKDVAETFIKYKESPSIFIGNTELKSAGVYLKPEKDLNINDFSIKSREIFYQKNPLFKIQNGGGLSLQNSDIKLEISENNLLKWNIFYKGEKLLELFYKTENEEVITGLEIKNKGFYSSKIFMGSSTDDPKSWGIFSLTEKEDVRKILGGAKFEETKDDLGWRTKWKGATLLAAKNTIGDSIKWKSDDSFVLLGDPTLSLKSENLKSDLNLTKDIGKVIWSSKDGLVDDIAVGDLNFDDKPEIFIRSGKSLNALYQASGSDNFRDIGEILRFGEGAKKVAAYNESNGDLFYLVQLSQEGKLIFHKNTNGRFFRKNIDLGIDNEITDFDVARLNSDQYKDLIILDKKNQLYFVYGRKGGFWAAQKIDSFNPNFEDVNEKYKLSEGQNIDKKITNPEKWKNLSNFFAGFEGAENASWLGESNDFVKITENKYFNASFKMKSSGNEKIKNGDTFEQSITIYSPKNNLNKFKLAVPFFAGFAFEEKSLSVSGCSGEPNINIESDSFLISGCDIEAQNIARFSWKIKAINLPKVRFLVEDIVGKDGVDDVVIPWEDENGKKFIKYLSNGSPRMYPTKNTSKTVDAPNSPISRTHRKIIEEAFPDGSTFPKDFDAETSAQEMLNCLKSSDNGLPDLYKTKRVEDLVLDLPSEKKFAGLQIPSIAFLAPGPQSIYIPPVSFPNPMPSMGTPVFWAGPSPPFVGSGWFPTSFFRLYVMPTTTLRVGIGICGGPIINPAMTPTGLPFPPQCFVIVPPLKSGEGTSNSESGGDDSNTSHNKCRFENPAEYDSENAGERDMLIGLFADELGSTFATGSFNLQVGSYGKNLDIAPPDIVTTWAKSQVREFSNYEFPSFQITLPDFVSNIKDDKKRSQYKNSLDYLSKSNFFKIKREKLEINYPKINKKTFDELKQNFSVWKKENKIRKELSVSESIEISNFSFDNFKDKLNNFEGNLSVNVDNLIEKIDSKLAGVDPELKNSLNNLKSKLKQLKSKLQQKTNNFKDLPRQVKSSAKNKIDELVGELENVEKIYEDNLNALDSYSEQIKEIKLLPEKIDKSIESLNKSNEVIKEYWSSWMKKNRKSVHEWKKFESKVTGILKAWNEIPDLFSDFSSNCTPGGGGGGTSTTRGTVFSWVIKIVLSAVKLPVIPMPKFPEVKVDLSKVEIGAELTVPEITFSPVEVSLPKLPVIKQGISIKKSIEGALLNSMETSFMPISQSMSSLENSLDSSLSLTGNTRNLALGSFNSSLDSILLSIDATGGVPEISNEIINDLPIIKIPSNLPIIPPAPDLVPQIDLPQIQLPQLPSLLPPPDFPNLIQPIIAIVKVIKVFLNKIFCGLSRGFFPIPEWMVATKVVELTNRTSLLPMDFVFSAQLPDFLPKIPPLPPISIAPQIELSSGLESFNEEIKGLFKTMNNMTQMMTGMGKSVNGGDVNNDIFSLDLESLKSKQNFNLVSLNLFEEYETKLQPVDNSRLVSEIKKVITERTENSLQTKKIIAENNLDQKLISVKNKLASLDYLPQDFDTSGYDLINKDPQPIDTIYYYSVRDNKSEKIIDFPLDSNYHRYLTADLDEDGKNEIIYSINDQVFIKRLFENTNSNPKKSKTSIIEKNFLEFTKYFSPVIDYDLNTKSNGSELSFLAPIVKDISYFEWIISDRPDRNFEPQVNSREKISKKWERIAFLLRSKGHKYEIRDGISLIKAVKGNPLFYGNKRYPIEKFSSSECDNENISKPFFPNETVIVGKDNNSRFLVKTKKRDGQYQEKIMLNLKKGEETIVDFAEICLIKGAIDYIDAYKKEKFFPKVGDSFFNDVRFELGSKDEVEIELFDGTPITIYGGEDYELNVFNPREKYLKKFVKLQQGNFYGKFNAFKKDGTSFSLSKEFLHDPQLADDNQSPQIIITQGEVIRGFIGERIIIDASKSYDDQQLYRAWWTKDGKIFLDSNNEKYSIAESMKIEIPAKFEPENFEVIFNLEDKAGNISSVTIPVEVIVPELKMVEGSVRDKELFGKIKDGKSGLEIGFLRNRDGKEQSLEKTTISKDNGYFNLEDLSIKTGKTIVKDKNGKTVAEILPTGRPVVIDKSLITEVNKENLQIEVKTPAKEKVVKIKLVSKSSDDIFIDSFSREISVKNFNNTNFIKVVDSNTEDDFIWKYINSKVVFTDNVNQKTLGVMDKSGDFSLTDYGQNNLKIIIKNTKKEEEPIVFQIKDENDKLVAEFFIPMKELSVQ